MRKIFCFECGKEIDKQWLKRIDLIVPICPDCYNEIRNAFEEKVPAPVEYNDRCNLR
ncbi:hypothetical protein GX441_12570 [bacterium]|nr:hypothetical protein [bacterium]